MTMYPKLKTSLTASIALICGLTMGAAITACSTSSLNIEVYRLRNEIQSLRRVKDGKTYVKPFAEAEGWYCMAPRDMQTFIEVYRYCMDRR